MRPIFHWTGKRARAQVLICLLASWLTCRLRSAVALLTFADTEPAPRTTRLDRGGEALVSATAKTKAATKQGTEEGEPVQCYQILLEHLKTLTRKTCRIAGTSVTFDKLSEPTPTERRIFELID